MDPRDSEEIDNAIVTLYSVFGLRSVCGGASMSDKGDRLKEAHNKGQRDARQDTDKGNTLTTLTGVYYQPPSDPDEKEVYDEGWKNVKEDS